MLDREQKWEMVKEWKMVNFKRGETNVKMN